MSINLNGNRMGEVYYGSTKIAEAYVGSTKVYQSRIALNSRQTRLHLVKLGV